MSSTGKHVKRGRALYWLLIPVAFASVLSLSWCGKIDRTDEIAEQQTPSPVIYADLPPAQILAPTAPTEPTPEPEPVAEPEPEPEPLPPLPWEMFLPHFLPETDPFNGLFDYKYDVLANGEIVEEFLNPEPIFFGLPDSYAQTESVTTFRGNNFRNDPTFGTVNITEGKLTEMYRLGTGTLDHWSGVGWSGEPAIVKWDFEIQQKIGRAHV